MVSVNREISSEEIEVIISKIESQVKLTADELTFLRLRFRHSEYCLQSVSRVKKYVTVIVLGMQGRYFAIPWRETVPLVMHGVGLVSVEPEYPELPYEVTLCGREQTITVLEWCPLKDGSRDTIRV